MPRLVVVLLLLRVLGACKSHDTPPTPPKRDAAAVEVDWARCERTIATLADHATAAQTIEALLDGCQVCGDWTPLLQWNKPQRDGGPTRAAIEQRMAACNAWCDPAARQRFMGTLDEARGTASRAPWRYLGEICKDKVSAVPDGRFMSAPYFALDRIARAVAAHGGPAADTLAKFWIALPPLSMNGTAVEAPTVDVDYDSIANNEELVTVVGDQLYVGDLPRAHLTSAGVQLVAQAAPYPGTPITSAELAKRQHHFAVLAPAKMPAKQLAAVLGAVQGVAFGVAVAAHTRLPGWPMVASLPAVPDLSKAPDGATVQDVVAAMPHPVPIVGKP